PSLRPQLLACLFADAARPRRRGDRVKVRTDDESKVANWKRFATFDTRSAHLTRLFSMLINRGAQQDRSRQFNAHCFGSPEVHRELKSVRLFDRNVSDLGSLEDFGDVRGGLPMHGGEIGAK